MSDYSIWVVQYGLAAAQPASSMLFGVLDRPASDSPFCFALLRSAEHTVLVDVGFDSPYHQQRLTAKYPGSFWQRPDAVLARLHVAAADVDTVVLTHKHFDHAQALEEFDAAVVHVQRREFIAQQELAGLPKQFDALRKATDADWLEMMQRIADDGRLRLVDGSAEVLPGLSVHPASDTHTPGSQYAVLDNGTDGRWVFPGDNVYVYENVEGRDGDGVYIPIGSATGGQQRWLEVADEMMQLVDHHASRLVPFHDADIWRRFPSRRFQDGLNVAELSLAGGHLSLTS